MKWFKVGKYFLTLQHKTTPMFYGNPIFVEDCFIDF